MTAQDPAARVAELEEELGRLRRIAFGSDIEFPLAWGLTGADITLLRCLIQREVVNIKFYAAARYPGSRAPHVSPDSSRVRAHHLRRKLEPLGIPVHSAGALGYYLDAEHRARLLEEGQARHDAEAAAFAATEAAMLARVA